MALNNRTVRILANTILLLGILISALVSPVSVLADGNATANALPNFSEFSQTVQNGKTEILRGVYVPGVLALPIIQQPSGSAGFVSNEDDRVTQFRMANSFGNIGLLAHNHLSGREFFNLSVGDEVRMVYGNGDVEVFVVAEVLRYQAMQPNSPYSAFRDLDTDKVLSVEKMFKKVYMGDRHLTFQTCIEQDGIGSWGRLFVIAIPKAEYDNLARFEIDAPY